MLGRKTIEAEKRDCKITISITRSNYEAFKALCAIKKTSPASLISDFIANEVAKNEEKIAAFNKLTE